MWICLFCCFKSQVNSYGHGGTVSSPNHTGKLEQAVNQYFVCKLTSTLLEWFSGREENDRRNYFMINLHESMGPGRDLTHEVRPLDLQSDSHLLPDTLPNALHSPVMGYVKWNDHRSVQTVETLIWCARISEHIITVYKQTLIKSEVTIDCIP